MTPDGPDIERIKEKYPDAEIKWFDSGKAFFLTVPHTLTAEEAEEIRLRFVDVAPRMPVTILADGLKIETLDFEDWLGFGIRNGWVSDQVCATHEGVPSTDEGRIEWDEGGDPCEVVLRVWPPEKWQEMRDVAARA
jgi:hypothetical protein